MKKKITTILNISMIKRTLIIFTVLLFTAFSCTVAIDSDGDGVRNVYDRDGDGVPDGVDEFPDDPTRSCMVTESNRNSADLDCDNDGVPNSDDNCPSVTNSGAGQDADQNGNGIGDACDDNIDGDNFNNSEDVDDDGDGLIEIHYLEDLNKVRFDLNGDGIHNNGSTVTGHIGDMGAPSSKVGTACADINTSTNLCGYELARNLDFDDTASYRNATANMAGLTSGTGWYPIGATDLFNDSLNFNDSNPLDSNPFNAIFEGNGNTIANLFIERDTIVIGLFSVTVNGSEIRNLGLVDVDVTYVGVILGLSFVGGLVGLNGGRIVSSYSTGAASGSDDFDSGRNRPLRISFRSSGKNDYVGGLVGANGGRIVSSYSTVAVNGGDGGIDFVGGLVGANTAVGTIMSSYSTGDVNGGGGDAINCRVGGLVGWNQGGMIVLSYSTGDVNGGDSGR